VKRARKNVRLKWGDQIGVRERELEVSDGCPHCACRSYRRVDYHSPCEHPVYMPVECVRCPALWAREKAAPASSTAAVEQAPERSLRARLKRAFCELIGRRAS
jgi:hypothetical protein